MESPSEVDSIYRPQPWEANNANHTVDARQTGGTGGKPCLYGDVISSR